MLYLCEDTGNWGWTHNTGMLSISGLIDAQDVQLYSWMGVLDINDGAALQFLAATGREGLEQRDMEKDFDLLCRGNHHGNYGHKSLISVTIYKNC